MVGAFLLFVVLFVYVLPLVFIMLFTWMLSSRYGVRLELSFADASRSLRLALLFGVLFGVLLFPVEFFIPATPAISLYVLAQLLIVTFTIFRLGFQAVVFPTGKSSLAWRIAHACKLTAVVLIFQPGVYIALGELR